MNPDALARGLHELTKDSLTVLSHPRPRRHVSPRVATLLQLISRRTIATSTLFASWKRQTSLLHTRRWRLFALRRSWTHTLEGRWLVHRLV